ncbi:urease accessory UreF family protein [Curvibacter sp. HBC28]|uniref:Urease accessory protein UreF n=1 Tax=Curvibacter microcysteis TaxID=3026419 RepID=A0ABT5MDF2_9BURK|nr:urease accessory UreF family protein [Curvibacter sp. HBC28]MDD0813151.1 urease accessory UreF family protein [Curvibacter sp. HBC28]
MDTTTTATTMVTNTELASPPDASASPAATAPAAAALPSAGLLQLIWLASPALPVGGFSYSEGLEAAVEWAGVNDEAQAAEWLSDQLHLSLARSDLAVVSAAVQALRSSDWPRLTRLNEWVQQSRETAELRLQSQQMGRSLVEWLRNLQPDTAAQLDGLIATYPVAFACAAAASPASAADICFAYAFAWCETMSQTAIKAVPLGQSAGQRILARLAQEIPAAVATAMSLGDDQRQAYTPRLAVLSARHETQYSRLFRS